jgi:hypothetical protein
MVKVAARSQPRPCKINELVEADGHELRAPTVAVVVAQAEGCPLSGKNAHSRTERFSRRR